MSDFENVKEIEAPSRFLKFLYENPFGRVLLLLLKARWISKVCGAFLNTRLSKILIKSFVKNNNIDLNDYESDNFTCFNDCFSRKIKAGKRTVDGDSFAMVSPCDAYLSVYKITNDTVMPVKSSHYTVSSLLKDSLLAKEFDGGYAFVFRLCVNHYHRYCFCANGELGNQIYIGGKLHTVRPIALKNKKVFCENSREYTVINTDNFGKVVQMEVGAMLVGKIKNYNLNKAVKGEEKGMFLYGGSTVILLTQPQTVTPLPEFLAATEKSKETSVKYGQRINI